MYILTAEQMRAADTRAIDDLGLPVSTLMERAGEGLAIALRAHFSAPRGDRVLVVCGRGNNGGDGMVAARLLRAGGSRVTVLLLGRGKDLTGATRENWARLVRTKIPRFEAPDAAALGRKAALFEQTDLIVDAILGTGSRGPLEGLLLDACRRMNGADAPCVAADLPTGVDATTGAADPAAVRATLTVTFAFPKFGHLVHPGRGLCGTLEVVDIGIPEQLLPEDHRRFEVLTPADVASHLPARAATVHKGDLGRVRIVGGSPGMLGAVALTARAALRTGSGLATVCVPRSLYGPLAPLILEATAALYEESDALTHTFRSVERQLKDMDGCQALAVGPGLSRNHEAAQLAQMLVKRARVPMVLDADGLNAFEGLADLLRQRPGPLVLTPHSGELARLIGRSREDVEKERLELPGHKAREWGAVVLLKGAPTVVASPDGRVRLNPTGNPGMATGGSGDVLTGVIVSLLGRGMGAFDAASVGAYVHGVAGDLACEALGGEGLLASDFANRLPEALRAVRAHGLANASGAAR